MTWNPLLIKGLSYLSPVKAPASLEFDAGLNVVFGASNTGKSFIVESIDYLLGGGRDLRDIQERVGYDRARLVLETTEGDAFTIQRGVNGGGFNQYNGLWLEEEPDHEGTTLREKHSANRSDNLSSFLLSFVDLNGKSVIKNKQQELQSFTIRSLAHLVVVEEEKIIKSSSPIFTGQRMSATAEYSSFRLLLTGVDDSAQIVQTQQREETVAVRQKILAKIELIDELIDTLQSSLRESGVGRSQAEEQVSQINQIIQNQELRISEVNTQLESRVSQRGQIFTQIENITSRIREIEGQLSRFSLLQLHYQSDLERLSSIEESGLFFVHLNVAPCPLCGTPPTEQHLDEDCDGNVEATIQAATGEIAKVERLSSELDKTASELEEELATLQSLEEQLAPQFQAINQEIQRITAPLGTLENNIGGLVRQTYSFQKIISQFDNLESYQQKKAELLNVVSSEPVQEKSKGSVDVATTVLDDYAQVVQKLLQEWRFPGAERVHFDMSAKDLVINGQLRSSSGKGVRAITHAAMTIGLMEFCRQNDLSHPGFVILDSPLLAYREPESAENSALANSDLKTHFYEYLANNTCDSQVIVIENEDPPINLSSVVRLTNFTKSERVGRYGFFPISS
jgi:chaperonin cofactor prefoldin